MSVMKEIEKREAVLRRQQEQLEVLLQKIKRNLSLEERSYFEQEINKLKDDLFKTEKDLKRLRKENRKAFIFGLAIFILVILMIFYNRLWNL